ncbi:recombinase family protein [Deinococcus sp. Leaf326]|uniref:recombinase family protein n=1 Tax=Deinococcus sp. Leaf326 TaxID=1736338 RepID=UPI00138EDD8E|nr:recombinase family protein [Deinococcus sp. Leaf326]
MSTAAQADRYGPERQRSDILGEADRAGLRITDWIEESVSGADEERGLENQYFALARDHPGLRVIWSHPNRVGRHVEVTVGIVRRLHKLGAVVHIAGIGNLRDRRNWREFIRDAVEAENDYSTIVYNLSAGKFAKAQRNMWPHGKQPFGYRLVRDERGRSTTLEPHPDDAPVYRTIVEMSLAGHGAQAIADHLNQLQVPNIRPIGVGRQSYGWGGTPVRTILSNPRYLGRMEYTGPDGQTTTVTYPPLITPEQWQAVQEGTADRLRQRSSRSDYPALFAGHLTCSSCGSTMSLEVDRPVGAQKRYARYVCHWHNKRKARAARGQPLCLGETRWRVTTLDEMGWRFLVYNLTQPEILLQLLDVGDLPLPDYSRRLEEIDAEMAKVLDMSVRLGLPESVALLRLVPLQEERARLQAVEAPVPRVITPEDAATMAQGFAERLARFETFEERRSALRRWRVRLSVDMDGIAGIQLRPGE